MSAHAGRLVTAAVKARLEAAALPVNVGHAPAGVGWQTDGSFDGYVVIHPTPGGPVDGPVDGTDDDAQPIYTITAIGASAEQAEWFADKANEAMKAAPLVVAGRAVQLVKCESLPGAVRDDTIEPQVWFAPARWRIWTTDAA